MGWKFVGPDNIYLIHKGDNKNSTNPKAQHEQEYLHTLPKCQECQHSKGCLGLQSIILNKIVSHHNQRSSFQTREKSWDTTPVGSLAPNPKARQT